MIVGVRAVRVAAPARGVEPVHVVVAAREAGRSVEERGEVAPARELAVPAAPSVGVVACVAVLEDVGVLAAADVVATVSADAAPADYFEAS